MSILLAMFGTVVIVGLTFVAVFDLIERTTSKQGYPSSVFRRKP